MEGKSENINLHFTLNFIMALNLALLLPLIQGLTLVNQQACEDQLCEQLVDVTRESYMFQFMY